MAAPRRPSALRHGLTSRHAQEQCSADVVALADALIGASPHDPAVIDAAREGAEAILYLRRVQQCRLHVMEECTLSRYARSHAERAHTLKLSAAVKRGDLFEYHTLREKFGVEHDRDWLFGLSTTATILLVEELGRHTKEFRRLGEYERRAYSARRKALRRLDYERIEAERRRAAAEGTRSRGKSAAPG